MSIAQQIRAELKEKGYSNRQVSVVKRSISVDVTVKTKEIKLSEIKEIVKKYERVYYCERTGEVLSGGNFYVFVNYEYGLK